MAKDTALWIEARDRAQFVRDFLAVDSTQSGGYLDELSADVLALVPIVEAAKAFTDDVTCLDTDCTHNVCLLNRAFAQVREGAKSQASTR